MPHRVQPHWNIHNLTRQQADQIIATVERHAASHRHVADAVHSLTQAMQTAVKDGVSEGKRHVNTVARYTAGACAAGVTALEYFDIWHVDLSGQRKIM